MLVKKASKLNAMIRGANSTLFYGYGTISLPIAAKNIYKLTGSDALSMTSNGRTVNPLLFKEKSSDFSSHIAQIDAYLHTFEFEKAEKKLECIIDGLETKEGVNKLEVSDIYLRYGRVLLTRYGVLKHKEALDYFKKALQLNPDSEAEKFIKVIEEHTMEGYSSRLKLR